MSVLSSPGQPLPAVPRVTVPMEVYYFDTDSARVVNNIAYLRWIEVCRTHLGAALGLSLAAMDTTGLVPVVARTEIDYLRPARLGDALLLTGELTRLEKVRSYMRFEVVLAARPEVVFARCVQTMVLVQLPSGRPQRAPAAWVEAYPGLIPG